MHPPVPTDDLTAVDDRQGGARGDIIEVTGRILNLEGAAVAGARLIVWQANCFGRYRHPNDTTSVPLDPNFLGFAELVSDSAGAYRIKTVKPGIYGRPDQMRPPHVHFEVHGKFERLVTQMYFPGEPLNAQDRLLRSANRPDLLIAAPVAAKNGVAHGIFKFDIVLARG
jgi:protocatechuate 3,4-dioxygenase beta subunit